MRVDPVLKLNQKPHTPYGIVSFSLGILGILLIIASISISVGSKPLAYDQKILVGSLEVVSMILSLGGIGVAIIGENNLEKERIFAHIALIMHLILLIYHGYVIWFGFFS